MIIKHSDFVKLSWLRVSQGFLWIYVISTVYFTIKGQDYIQDESLIFTNTDFLFEFKFPYIDYTAVYPVGLYFYISPIVGFFTRDVLAIRLLSWMLLSLFVLLSLKRSKSYSSILISLTIFVYWTQMALVWNFALIALLIGLVIRQSDSSKLSHFGMFLFGVAAAIRPDFLLIVIYPTLRFIMLKKSFTLGFRNLLFYVLGFSPTLFNFLLLIGDKSVNTWVTLQSEIRHGRYFEPLIHLNLETYLLITLILVSSFILLRTWYNQAAQQENREIFSYYPGLILLGLLQLFQRADSWHVRYLIQIILGILLISLPGNFKFFKNVLNSMLLLSILIPVAYLARFEVPSNISKSIFPWNNRSTSLEYCSEKRCTFLDPGQLALYGPILDVLQRPAEKARSIFIGPSDLKYAQYGDTWIYSIVSNPACTRYTEMNPGDSNSEKSTLNDQITNCHFLILNDRYNNVDNGWVGSVGGEKINKTVRNNFVEIYNSNGFRVFDNINLQ
jgi:hypothetical protein